MNDNNSLKVAVLTQRIDTIEETLKGMASDVRDIRDGLSENRGVLRAIKWTSHGVAAIGGMLAGYLGFHKG